MDEEYLDSQSDTLSDNENIQESNEELLKKILSYKETGNEQYKKGKYNEAINTYDEGLEFIEKLRKKDVDGKNVEIENLETTLQLNKSMIYLKSSEWFKVIQVTSKILKEDQKNMKALYRRGLARIGFSMYEEAREDFLAILDLEPGNAAAIQQLQIIRQKISESNEKSRGSFSKIFSKGLYTDRQRDVEIKKAKERESRREIYEKEINEKKLKGDADNSKVIPFEEWEKEYIAKNSNSTDKPLDSNANSQQKSHKVNSNSTSNSPSAPIISSKSSDIELDDEDMKILAETKKMGYCYFRRTLTDQEKELNQQFVPKLIEETKNENTSNDHISDPSRLGISSWNSKGTTFEDKDVTSTAKVTLKKYLEASSFEEIFRCDNKITVSVTSVDEIDGEASVAMVRGTRRFLFDFSVKLKGKYESINLRDNTTESTNFSISIPSLTSMSSEEDIFGLKECSIELLDNKNTFSTDIQNQICNCIKEQFCFMYLKSQLQQMLNDFHINI
ncbi:TPR repeat-containing protein [Cryptosporidium muris RN66]|uniref:TPR repeat-containing protein n=1 Tax=Cryptosporidium muris (strain RN66) TaxID=441375 RepID=B6AB53_CRYMR|nr:TPR repeat-containing protein [Cryptosporidium muris RN66]EEA05605.1 TPR repeat-containing protein [Cryptosporidium muris RN66]|eukprot:XP_002139954.1 TPR repeat-containing protein [Cryptosporidium muris RN66]